MQETRLGLPFAVGFMQSKSYKGGILFILFLELEYLFIFRITKEMQIKALKETRLSQESFQESFIASSLAEHFQLIRYHRHSENF